MKNGVYWCRKRFVCYSQLNVSLLCSFNADFVHITTKIHLQINQFVQGTISNRLAVSVLVNEQVGPLAGQLAGQSVSDMDVERVRETFTRSLHGQLT